MTKKNKLSFIVTGPTGVGKTDFSILLAKKINGEILNIDVGQFYTPLTIGTAKPEWKKDSIPHHLFDIIDDPLDLTVIDYKNEAVKKLNEVWQKDKTPIFVGGSGFYVQSLLFPPKAKSELENQNYFDFNDENLWQKLYEIDPIRAKQINKNDKYRITRALEIWQQTGILPSKYKLNYEPISDFVLIILIRDREELYDFINARVVKMIEQGWIEEVQNLSDAWKQFLKRKKIIGYDDILNYLENDFSKQILIETIQKKVRNYAKRQITFLKMLSKKIINAELEDNRTIYAKKIIWVNLTNINTDCCIKLVENC